MEAYPLQWPLGYKRSTRRTSSSFKQSMEQAQRFLHNELRMLKATELIVSTNLPVRKDGMLYADYMSRKIDDPGVAIYFKYDSKDVVMCCDRYQSVWENIYALGKGIEALRGMDRWGVSDFLERAFTGFKALPENASGSTVKKYWWSVLGVNKGATWEEVSSAYRTLAKQYHPDAGGSDEKFSELSEALEQARVSINQH